MEFFRKDWCKLEWTQEVIFENKRIKIGQLFPGKSGFYRVRPTDKDCIVYMQYF